MFALFLTFHNSQLEGASCASSISSLPQFSIVEASQILIFIEYNDVLTFIPFTIKRVRTVESRHFDSCPTLFFYDFP